MYTYRHTYRHTRKPNHRPGFTLIELLVVISIIAILLTLVSVAGYRAIVSVRQATIAMEVNQLESAVGTYKTARGGDIFPDCSEAVTGANGMHVNVLVAHFRKAFPRNRESLATIQTLAGRLDQAEALVYFLGGNPNPANNPYDNQEYPISGPGQSKKFYDFATARLDDTADSDGYCVFVPAYGALRAPYVYFDSRTYGLSGFSGGVTAPFGICFPYGSNNPTATSQWESPTTFQIISAGLDGNFGAVAGAIPSAVPYKFFPSGGGYTREDRDNVTSFAEGSLDSKLP